ncbi:MAG: hypothetical protein ACW98F_00105 [Candidatus Hodarchaeales archaeon]|jgi:hypothetical protein
MPEELQYKITFDTSEVPQKLQEVKTQMDMLLAQNAFFQGGPDPYPFSQFFSPQDATPGLMQRISGFAQDAASGVPLGFQQAQGTYGDIRQAFNQVSEAARLGYSKFTGDVELQGLMSKAVEYSVKDISKTRNDVLQEIQQQGWFESIWKNVTSAGYDPTMPMTRREYEDLNRGRAGRTFMNPSWGEALGVGAAFALGSPLIGGLGAAALGTKLAMHPFLGDLRHRQATEDFVSRTSWRFLSGQFTQPETRDIARFVEEIPDRPGMKALEYERPEIDMLLREFTQAGGYDYARTAEEYKRVTERLFEDHRTVMHLLHKTSKEAVGIMGQLTRDFGVTDFSNFIAQMTATANVAGLTGEEMTMFSTRAAEMVRGSGYSLRRATEGAANMLADVTEMARRGIYTPEQIRQAGGVENLALQNMRSAYNYAASPWGMVTEAAFMSAQLGGAPDAAAQLIQMGPTGRLASAANLLQTPQDFMNFFGRRQQIADQLGPEFLAFDEVLQNLRQASMITGRGQFTDQEFAGYLAMQGVAPEEINRQVGLFRADPQVFQRRTAEDIRTRMRMIEDRQEAPISRWWRGVRERLDVDIMKPAETIAEELYYGLEEAENTAMDMLHEVTGEIFRAPGVGLPLEVLERMPLENLRRLYRGVAEEAPEGERIATTTERFAAAPGTQPAQEMNFRNWLLGQGPALGYQEMIRGATTGNIITDIAKYISVGELDEPSRTGLRGLAAYDPDTQRRLAPAPVQQILEGIAATDAPEAIENLAAVMTPTQIRSFLARPDLTRTQQARVEGLDVPRLEERQLREIVSSIDFTDQQRADVQAQIAPTQRKFDPGVVRRYGAFTAGVARPLKDMSARESGLVQEHIAVVKEKIGLLTGVVEGSENRITNVDLMNVLQDEATKLAEKYAGEEPFASEVQKQAYIDQMVGTLADGSIDDNLRIISSGTKVDLTLPAGRAGVGLGEAPLTTVITGRDFLETPRIEAAKIREPGGENLRAIWSDLKQATQTEGGRTVGWLERLAPGRGPKGMTKSTALVGQIGRILGMGDEQTRQFLALAAVTGTDEEGKLLITEFENLKHIVPEVTPSEATKLTGLVADLQRDKAIWQPFELAGAKAMGQFQAMDKNYQTLSADTFKADEATKAQLITRFAAPWLAAGGVPYTEEQQREVDKLSGVVGAIKDYRTVRGIDAYDVTRPGGVDKYGQMVPGMFDEGTAHKQLMLKLDELIFALGYTKKGKNWYAEKDYVEGLSAWMYNTAGLKTTN